MRGFDMEMSDLLAVFLEEAEEQLQRLDDGFLSLEKDPGNQEILKEVFRAAHTLKGSSATMGYTEIAELTHAMENLLDFLRSGSALVTLEGVNLLLGGTDVLRALIGQVSRGEPLEADTEELVSGLRRVSEEASGQEQTSAKQTKKPTKRSPKADSTPGVMALNLEIDKDCPMPSVRAFMVYNALAGLGEIVSANPSQDDIDNITAGQLIEIDFAPSCEPIHVIEAISRLAEVRLLSGDEEDCGPADEPESEAIAEQVAEVQTKPEAREPKPAREAGPGPAEAPKSIQTVRVGVERLDTLMNLVAELVIDRTRIAQIEYDLANRFEGEEIVQDLAETAVHIGRVVTELQEHIMKVRLLPVEQVFSRFPRMVRDLAVKAGKEIDFVLEGQETELDRSILEDIVDPITHLLRNAVDHGVEPPDEREAAGKPRRARVVLAAKQEENRIIIEVEEDGRGISLERVKAAALKKGVVGEDAMARMSDDDALQLIFASGLSTAEKVTDVSGRGVGMDVVRNNIQNLSGSVEVHTELGSGTKFRINLPLTLAIIQALVTGVGEQVFVIPLSAVAETFRCDRVDIRRIDGHPAIKFRGSVLHLLDLAEIFGIPSKSRTGESTNLTFVVVRVGGMKVGLIVDRLIGEHEVVIKSLGSFFGDIKGIAGATILGDGRVALIVDCGSLGALINRRKLPRSSKESIAA